ncbi:MAG: transglutaminase domain-containing protein, partial [Verrucomicrobiota bacterium]|nr:transglutaminase domain-containing protein [Verrucomicrobiota bacterium]
RYQWPLAGAVGLLLLEIFWPRGRRTRQKPAVAVLVLLLLVFPTEGATLKQAQGNYQQGEYALAQKDYEELLRLNPGNPKLHYNAGTAAYQSGKHNEAAKHFRSSLRTSDLNLQHRAFYNLGNTHYRLGAQMQRPEDQIPAWEEAAGHFEAASELNPQDNSSNRNLKFIRNKIEEAKRKLEQLSDELPLDGVTRFKNQEDKKFALRIFPPNRELIPERPYWRMFALDHYVHGVAKVSDSLKTQAQIASNSLNEYGGRKPAEEIRPGQWRFRFEPLFSEFLPLNGPFANARVEENSWKYNPVVLQAKLKSVPTHAINYTISDPAGNGRLAASTMDAPLQPERENDFTVEREGIYPFTTLALNLKTTEISQLLSALASFTEDDQLPLDEFNEQCIQWLHKRHKYTRQTRIPEDKENDPVIGWMTSEEPGHCEYFAYSYVLLARSAGFPARVVCGFAGGEWDEKTQSWTNVQTDAHAWAEVFNGKEWIRIDPTPPEDGQGEGEDPQQSQNNGQGKTPDQNNGQGNPQNQDGKETGDQQADEDRDEGELSEELLETLRQAQQLLDALKTDEKPLGAIEAKGPRFGQRKNKKDW